MPCHWPSCGKYFHRQDLLDRHLATRQYASQKEHLVSTALLTYMYSGGHSNQQSNAGTPRRLSDASGTSSSYSARSFVSHDAIRPLVPTSNASTYVTASTEQEQTFITPTSNASLRYQPFFFDQTSGPSQFHSIPYINVIE